MNIKRWVVLPQETDKELVKQAKSQDRSIANMLRKIVTNYFEKIDKKN